VFGLTLIALQPAWLAASWLRVKLLLVLGLLGYHHWCWRLLQGFRSARNTHSSRWYRGFNEIPSVLLLAIVFLAILKPA
jgi:putative membrane protein